MTTSTTSTFDPSRDTIIRRSYQLAGLLEASQLTDPNDVALAADILQMELTSMVAEGQLLTWIERTTQALVASTAEYTLTDALEIYVDGNGLAGTIVPSSGAETPVRAITRADYQLISNKATEATPTLVFVERLATVKLLFWPVPAATSSFRYQKIRYPRDMDTGTVTLDLSKRWHKAITYALASQLCLAKSMPMERVQWLDSKATSLKEKAMQSDVEHVPAQMITTGGYHSWRP